MTDRRTADRLDIADTMYRYAEAVDHLGAHPARPGEPDPALAEAIDMLGDCLADDSVVRLYFHRPGSDPVQAGAGGPARFAPFVRQYFTDYGYGQTFHLVDNIRIRFAGENTATVRSYINTTHWLADGRMLLAPIEYEDTVIRGAERRWLIQTREIIVWRW